MLVAPGQALPADGIILEGESEIDLALLTGESAPRHAGPGAALPGGAVNVAQAIVVRISAAPCDSTLAQLVRLAEKAGQGKPALALWADRVGAWSVAALLVLTAIVYLFWHWADPARALPAAIAVLVVTCPCALSLATPTALAAASGRLLRRGVLAVSPHTLETFARATHVVFDKTGTLTLGRPRVQAIDCFGALDAAQALAVAAGLEAGNAHPLAAAIRAQAPRARQAGAVAYRPGQGVEGWVDGVRYRLGSAAFAGAIAGPMPMIEAAAGVLWLARDGQALARFALADAVRPEIGRAHV